MNLEKNHLFLYVFITFCYHLHTECFGVNSLRAAFFESTNVDKAPATTKLLPKLCTSSSAHDLPMRLNQHNNANPQMIDGLNCKSNFNNNNLNKSNPTVDNHRNSFYPKMNFTSSIMTTASTLPNKMVPGNVPIILDTDANKTSKHADNLAGPNDHGAMMQNMVTQNFNLTNSFSTGAMTNLNRNPLNNCNFNSTQFQHQPPQQQRQPQQQQLQQQHPPPLLLQPASTTLAYSSNTNTTQIQTSNSQATTQQMQSQQQHQQQQNLGTKVTRHIRSRKKKSCFFSLSIRIRCTPLTAYAKC